MKNVLLTILVVLMLGTIVNAENVVFGGGRYDEGVVFSAGYGLRVSGNLWSLSYIDIGSYQAFNTELAYIVRLPGVSKLGVGLIAGPNADWNGPYELDGLPAVTYLVGAAGLIGIYDINEKLGAWGYAKYKFSFEGEDAYRDGYLGGGGLIYRF